MGITYLLTCVLRFNFELKATCHLAKALICASGFVAKYELDGVRL